MTLPPNLPLRALLSILAMATSPAAMVGVEREVLVLEGFVVGPDGNPAIGVAITSSAGGRTTTDAAGAYRLALPLREAVGEVEVTAAGTQGRAGVRVTARPGAQRLDPLRLGSGASCSPVWSPTFGGVPGLNGIVHTLVELDAGEGPALYAGGGFSGTVARWDGTAWSRRGGLSSVHALTVFDDGTGAALFAAGNASFFGGSETQGIARWNGSGWSALGSGLGIGGSSTTPYARSLAVWDDGDGAALYVGGWFQSAGSVPARGIAKWDGASWSALGSGMEGTHWVVEALMVFDDGTGAALYAAGHFTTAGGIPANRIARWDGTSWSALASGLDGPVLALEVHDDGGGAALHVAGNFTSAGGAPAKRVARWDGSSWSALGGGIGVGSGENVLDLAVHDDGSGPQLYAAGYFSDVGGAAAMNLARWDGASWAAVGTWDHVLDPGQASVRALASIETAPGHRQLHVGGSFSIAEGTAVRNVACWDGASASSLGNGGLHLPVLALTVHDDGSGAALHAGGSFLSVGGVAANRVARWDGAGWAPLGSGMDAEVRALIEHDDGSGLALYAGGSFTAAGGMPATFVARWDGSGWSALGGGMDGDVRVFAVHDDGGGPALYAGGDFTTAGGAPASRIAKWNGSAWVALGAGVVGRVEALAAYDDGSGPALYVGGGFGLAGGQSIPRFARWNGAWSSPGVSLHDRVFALRVHDDGSGPALFLGRELGGALRWSGTPDVWEFGVTERAVSAFAVYDPGQGAELYAAGSFTTVESSAALRIARWDGTSWSPLGSGTDAPVSAMAVFDDGNGPALFVGGSFTDAGGAGDAYLARWGLPADDEPPVLACPEAVFATDGFGGPPGEVVTFDVPASDCRDPAPSVACVPPSGSFFPRGTTWVTCTATDAAGNESSCQFPVIVETKARRRDL